MIASRFSFLGLAALMLSVGTIRADDTADFLDPANWQGRGDIWTIKDGVIVGETKEDPKYNTFFVTKKTYADFEMSFKLQLREGTGNSGVQIRSKLTDDKKFIVKGPQVDAGKGYWGSLYAEGFGMMKASDPKTFDKAVKEMDFNEYLIVAKGKHITIVMNGVTMVDGDFEKLPSKDKPDAPSDGVIAIQCHGGYPKMRVEVKDITFKILK